MHLPNPYWIPLIQITVPRKWWKAAHKEYFSRTRAASIIFLFADWFSIVIKCRASSKMAELTPQMWLQRSFPPFVLCMVLFSSLEFFACHQLHIVVIQSEFPSFVVRTLRLIQCSRECSCTGLNILLR